MKLRLKPRFVIFMAGLLLFSMDACNKNNNPTAVTADTQSAQDNAYAEGTYSDAYNAVDVAASSNGDTSYFKTDQTLDMLSGVSIKITIDSLGLAKTLTIDFGAKSDCRDGRSRSGQIIATWNGRYRDSGTVITIMFKKYTVNGDTVKGTKTITNLGHNSNGNIHYSVVVNGSIVTSTGTITWSSTRDREWVEGERTFYYADDVYHITGTANGTNRKGQTFSITIVKPLVIALNCHWIEQGSFDITTSGSSDIGTVDYGSGTCDNKATYQKDGKTYDFTLR